MGVAAGKRGEGLGTDFIGTDQKYLLFFQFRHFSVTRTGASGNDRANIHASIPRRRNNHMPKLGLQGALDWLRKSILADVPCGELLDRYLAYRADANAADADSRANDAFAE